jgi:hypothetical protein
MLKTENSHVSTVKIESGKTDKTVKRRILQKHQLNQCHF